MKVVILHKGNVSSKNLTRGTALNSLVPSDLKNLNTVHFELVLQRFLPAWQSAKSVEELLFTSFKII